MRVKFIKRKVPFKVCIKFKKILSDGITYRNEAHFHPLHQFYLPDKLGQKYLVLAQSRA